MVKLHTWDEWFMMVNGRPSHNLKTNPNIMQCEAPKIAKLAYNSNKYGVMVLVPN